MIHRVITITSGARIKLFVNSIRLTIVEAILSAVIRSQVTVEISGRVENEWQ
jgi:hypothetical protein